MKLNKTQKVVHWTLLLALVVLYAILIFSSEEHDQVRTYLSRFAVLFGTIWIGGLTVLALRNRESKDEIAKGALGAYHRLLERNVVLIPLNVILATGSLYLVYQLSFFRQVEFLCDEKLELFVNDRPGQMEMIGFLEPKTVNTYRVRVGIRTFYYKELGGNRTGALLPTKVLGYFQESATQRLTLKLKNEHESLD